MLAARRSTDPDSGHSASWASVRPVDAEVMYIVRRPGPPKATLVGRGTGTGTCSATAPSGVNRVRWAPSQKAHQTSPAASTRSPSGMPGIDDVSAKTRRPTAAPDSTLNVYR
jgi:hypothetical protein